MNKNIYFRLYIREKIKSINTNKLRLLITMFPIFLVVILNFDNIYIIALLNSLLLQIAFSLLLISFVLLIFKSRFRTITYFVSALYLFVSINIFDNTVYTKLNTKSNISISHFNVLRTNKDYNKVITSAINSNSDIISFQEISSDWKNVLINKLSKKYPYYEIKEIDDNYFGIAVFSKYKLYNKRIKLIEGVPNIFATIYKNKKAIDIVTAHTNSPISKSRFNKRNKHIAELTKYLKDSNENVLVIGDFNAVPWDSNITKFKLATQLKDSRNKYSPTWPRYMGKLGIPLDYIFYSKGLTCTSFNVITKSSSDHCGVKGVYNIQ